MVINEKLILKRVSDLEGRGNIKYYVHPPVGLYYCTNSCHIWLLRGAQGSKFRSGLLTSHSGGIYEPQVQ